VLTCSKKRSIDKIPTPATLYLTNIFMHVIPQLIKGVAAFGQAASHKSV
jgi:hypothetical protein